MSTRKLSQIQSVPFKILADCDARVNEFFQSAVQKKQDKSEWNYLKSVHLFIFYKALTASFRGRPLNGTNITLPKGYAGVVFHESIAPFSENEERRFHIIHNFDSLVYWNFDRTPSQNDKFLQAINWIDIAEVVSKKINLIRFSKYLFFQLHEPIIN